MKAYQFDFPTNSSFSFIHLVNNNYFKIHVLYDSFADNYYMNIDKFINGKYVNIINSIKVTTGIDLFLQFRYFNLGKFFIIPTSDSVYNKDPSASTIKNNYFIYWEHD